jgi:2,4-dienoyl-CoA reductase (NADPH2)
VPAVEHPLLLSPLRVGRLELPNRVVMGAMHTRLETLDRPVQRMAAFLGERAAGEVGLILTGGHAPSADGRMDPESPVLADATALADHREVCRAVHAAGGRIVLQILHAGRYAKVEGCVGPTAVRARINPLVPRRLATHEVWEVVEAFAQTARLARDAGYDGVEVMGSEGYLVSQFTAASTNTRDDEFGGDLDGRLRLPIEIVRAIREAVDPDCLLVYRISAIDLVEGGLTGTETEQLARAVVEAGADVLNTGIGWHESEVPTMAAAVPRAAWSFAIRRVKAAVDVPVIASNRISSADVAEGVLAAGDADLVSMARPLLADPQLVRKVRLGRAAEVTPCIACNQACLDHIFTGRTATCMLNPFAGRELELVVTPAGRRRRIAVVGGGPAGMAFAATAAERGHDVVLQEAAATLGGQLDLARRIPGKTEFEEALRSFAGRLSRAGVDVRLGAPATAGALADAGYDDVVLATGVVPRIPVLEGIDHPSVASYADILSGRVQAGERVAIVGAGGIGFDVAEYLVGDHAESRDAERFLRGWGVDVAIDSAGGLTAPVVAPPPSRAVTILQRSPGRAGRTLGKSTGWILKSRLRRAGVATVSGVTYRSIGDDGLRYAVDGAEHLLAVDTVVICAGQESERTLHDELDRLGVASHVIGGARRAAELDATGAIDEATRLALHI